MNLNENLGDLREDRPQSKAASVYEAIRHDILTLELRPGEKVSEQMLSERYDVGKASIRVALAKLSQDGLIVNRNRSGHSIASISFKDIGDIYQIRKMLIPAAALLAASKPTDGLKAAYNLLTELTVELADTEAVLNFCIANRQFIVEIGKSTGNIMLENLIAAQEDKCLRIQFFGTRTLTETQVLRAEYDKIWSAISSGDGEAARDAAIDALDKSEQRIIAAFLRLPEITAMNLGDLIPR